MGGGGGGGRGGISFFTRGRAFATAPQSVSQDDHSQSHRSSSHGNGRCWEGVDKMETEEESAMSLIDRVRVHVWDLCQLSKFVIRLLAERNNTLNKPQLVLLSVPSSSSPPPPFVSPLTTLSLSSSSFFVSSPADGGRQKFFSPRLSRR